MATPDRSTIEWLLGLGPAVNQQPVIALLKGKTKEELEELLNSKDADEAGHWHATPTRLASVARTSPTGDSIEQVTAV
ncbi:hypothetical protein V498_00136 [Pseudogymnoascus sp. VKM F-4517 (FW-2822)]|nr:hypothetical protein V498_00136 [Pseudogymnoascus sp. VKM F-4517 (FW-2822)]